MSAEKRVAIYAAVVAVFAYVALCFLLTAEGSASVIVWVTFFAILASLSQCRFYRH